VRALAVYLPIATAVRLPSFLTPFWSPDEGFLATEAQLMLHGGKLYGAVVDRKPPMLPWLYEAAFYLVGSRSLWPLRVLAILASVATACFVAAIARRRWGERYGLWTGVLLLLTSTGLAAADAQAATFEVFMLPATAAAVYFAERHWFGTAGFASALAFLVKQQGAIVFVVVMWCWWEAGRRPRAACAMFIGLLWPIGLAMVLTSPHGFLFWVIGSSGSYSTSGSLASDTARGFGNLGIMTLACLGLVIPAIIAGRRGPREVTLWLWLASSAIGMVAGLHFFGHYYIQLLPPVILLGAKGLVELRKRNATSAARKRNPWRMSLAYTCIACLGFLLWASLSTPVDEHHSVMVGHAIKRDISGSQTVFIWGMHPEEYWIADREPATPYLTAGFLSNFAGGVNPKDVGIRYAVPGAWKQFEKDVRHAPPALIVDDSDGQDYPISEFQPLRQLVARNYTRCGDVNGAIFYRRDDLPSPSTTAHKAADRHRSAARQFN
jgi:4-amino-4-deoxy-L-arabinose transferase-like glycosyltransferase